MEKAIRKKGRKSRLIANRSRTGYVFVAPFVIGFALFILLPIIQSMIFSFSELSIVASGYSLKPLGFGNYHYVLGVDVVYRQQLIASLKTTIRDTLIIVPFSFFSAVVLSKPFHGRTLARAIFFLPVIIATGMLTSVDSNSVISMVMNRDTVLSADAAGASQSSLRFIEELFAGSLPAGISSYISQAIDNLYDIVIRSGIQIIIFISGLNTISPSLFESSDIEGATGWVNFWKITFPMCGPYLLLNVVYTIIDSFTNSKNPLITRIWSELCGLSNFGVASAAAWLYFLLVFAVLGVAFFVISRVVFYNE